MYFYLLGLLYASIVCVHFYSSIANKLNLFSLTKTFLHIVSFYFMNQFAAKSLIVIFDRSFFVHYCDILKLYFTASGGKRVPHPAKVRSANKDQTGRPKSEVTTRTEQTRSDQII